MPVSRAYLDTRTFRVPTTQCGQQLIISASLHSVGLDIEVCTGMPREAGDYKVKLGPLCKIIWDIFEQAHFL